MGNKYTHYLGQHEIKDEFYEVSNNGITKFEKKGSTFSKEISPVFTHPLNRNSTITEGFSNGYDGRDNKAIFRVTTNGKEKSFYIFKNAQQFYNEVDYAISHAPEQENTNAQKPETRKNPSPTTKIPEKHKATNIHIKSTSYSIESDLAEFEICIPAIPAIIYDLLKRTVPQYEMLSSIINWHINEGDRISSKQGNQFYNHYPTLASYGDKKNHPIQSIHDRLAGNSRIYMQPFGCAISPEVIDEIYKLTSRNAKLTMRGNNIGQKQEWDYNRKMPIIKGSTDKEKYFAKIRLAKTEPSRSEEYIKEALINNPNGLQLPFSTIAKGPKVMVATFLTKGSDYCGWKTQDLNNPKFSIKDPAKYEKELREAFKAFSSGAPCVIKTHNPELIKKNPNGIYGFKWEHQVLEEQRRLGLTP